MGFARVKDIVDAFDEGRTWYQSFRKVSGLTTVQGQWCDLSMAPGNPRPNYYVGDALTAKTLTGNYGLFTGGDVSPSTKCLKNICISSLGTTTPATYTLCDYLLYYPLIDMDTTDEQGLFNTVTLPRYTTGEGVQALIVATNPYVGGSTIHLRYTNSRGDQNRTTRLVTSNVASYIGNIINSGTATSLGGNAFIPLQQGDTGIQSVQGIQFDSPNGGLAALVLVKPLATVITRDTTAASELDFIFERPSLPIIVDGAYLNFICCPNGTISSVPIIGDITVVWG